MTRTEQLEQITKMLETVENMPLLEFYFDLIVQRVRNYCHIPPDEPIPTGLDLIIVQMVYEYFRIKTFVAESGQAGQVVGAGAVKAITRGDTKIEYSDGIEVGKTQGTRLDGEDLGVSEFVQNYYEQLHTFRRLATLKR